jgi:large subunit ribosomal protein L4
MSSLPVYNMSGKQVGQYEIASSDLVNSINKQLLQDVVVMYQACLRQGTKQTKTRSGVAGTTKKMYKQKGTGNARAGSRRSGVRRGGGHMKALSPRDFSYRLPKKAVRLALRMAVASKIAAGKVTVVEGLECSEAKTKVMAGLLSAMGVSGQTALVATKGHQPLVYKSGRNIAGVSVMPCDDLNAYAVLRVKNVIIDKSALDEFKAKAVADIQAKAKALAAV